MIEQSDPSSWRPLHKSDWSRQNLNRTHPSAQFSRRNFMAGVIPEKYLDVFQKKAFAHLATLMPDGTPQVTPVWVDYDGTHILVNSARGRQKDKNMQRNRAVALSIQDPDNPYRYLEVRGKVVDITE